MKNDKQKNITPYENMTIDEMTALAEQGDKLVQNDIGICYLIGVGVEKDLQKAIEWFTKSAKQGYANGSLRQQNKEIKKLEIILMI